MNLFTAPGHEKSAFNCPFCKAFSEQIWTPLFMRTGVGPGSLPEFQDIKLAYCRRCKKYSVWHLKRMIYPDDAGVPPPNDDLQEDIKKDYMEARSIVNKSPRGSAALLRLCIQELCMQLGEKGKDINADIANLVEQGLSVKIQQALDIVRVVGNNAVHPGEMDIKDDRETAMKLFELLNLIADSMITQKKEIDRLYSSLPENARKAIEDRDKKI